MARMRDKRLLALLAAVFGAAGIFVLDLTLPPLIALAGLYVLPMIALVWWGKKRVLYLGAVGCAGLILLGYALVPVRQELPYALVNRLLPIAVIFVFAIAMGRRIDARRELLRQYSRTKRLLDERNAALEAFLAQHRYEDEKTQA